MPNAAMEERDRLIRTYAGQLALSSKVKGWLGPPDLVIGSGSERCLHVLGVDVESAASVAAFINTLLLSFPASITPAITTSSSGGRRLSEKTAQVVYCCYNAERALDVRIQASIPGGITCTIHGTTNDIDDDMMLEQDEALWRQTRTSAVLRAILYHHDNHSYNAASICPQDSLRRVCGDYQQVLLECIKCNSSWAVSPHWNNKSAASIDNYLTDAILATNLAASTVAATSFGDNKLLMARMMHRENRISDAIQLLCSAISKEQAGDNPEMLAAHLHHQLRLLGGSTDDSIDIASLAKEAVRHAPLEPAVWIGLARVYLDRMHYDLALLALNSCPSHALAWHHHARDKRSLESNLHDLRSVHIKAIYDMLARISEALGWQTFMQLRDDLFITCTPPEDALLRTESGGTNANNEMLPTAAEQRSDECALQKGQPGCRQEMTRSKRICEPAIDELVFALHADLSALRSHLASHDQAGYALPDQWRLARLCLRLHKVEVAKQLLHALANSKTDKLDLVGVSLELLTGLYAEGGQIGHALVAISRTLSLGPHLLLSTPSTTGNGSVSFGIKAAISGMAARFGTAALRDAMHVLAAEIGQEAVEVIGRVIDIECAHIDY